MLFSISFLPAFGQIFAFCNFDKTPTLPTVGFELFILIATALCIGIWAKSQAQVWLRFLLISIGVLIFELFTSPMWNNYRLGVWAYVYQDVSWILTLGWSVLILSVLTLVDRLLPTWKEWKRFPLYLLVLTLIAFPLEILVVALGIRSYPEETLAALSGIQIFGVPIEALYYLPVFMGLVICFYKYWSFVLIEDKPLIPLKNRKWLRSFFLAFLAIFLFEVMIEPMVNSSQFPRWSQIFHDVSFLMIGIWILIVGAAAAIVGRFFAHYPIPIRFLIAVGVTSALAVPIEDWLIHRGFRVYAENVIHQYTGYRIPMLDIPVELAFGIPFYMSLIIVFIRYWESVIDNRL